MGYTFSNVILLSIVIHSWYTLFGRSSYLQVILKLSDFGLYYTRVITQINAVTNKCVHLIQSIIDFYDSVKKNTLYTFTILFERNAMVKRMKNVIEWTPCNQFKMINSKPRSSCALTN